MYLTWHHCHLINTAHRMVTIKVDKILISPGRIVIWWSLNTDQDHQGRQNNNQILIKDLTNDHICLPGNIVIELKTFATEFALLNIPDWWWGWMVSVMMIQMIKMGMMIACREWIQSWWRWRGWIPSSIISTTILHFDFCKLCAVWQTKEDHQDRTNSPEFTSRKK